MEFTPEQIEFLKKMKSSAIEDVGKSISEFIIVGTKVAEQMAKMPLAELTSLERDFIRKADAAASSLLILDLISLREE
jgi:hypothetical protein